MALKGLATVAVAATFFMLAGCGKERSDERLIEITVKLEKQEQQIERLTATVEGVARRLREIEASRESVSVSSRPPQGESKETAESPETARYISGLRHQLDLAVTQLGETQESMKEHIERFGQFMDHAAAWRAMGEPEELSRRLDVLAGNYLPKIGDPTLREKLAADVEELKNRFQTPLTPEQQRDLARTITSEAIRMMSDNEKSQTWLEGQAKALEEVTNPRELAARVNVTLELWKTWEVRQLAQRYNVPVEVMEDSGLTLTPEAGYYIPAEVAEGLGLTLPR